MADLTKQENNSPAKQNHGVSVALGVAGNWLYDNVVKGGLPLAITYLTGYLAWLRGFDPLWLVVLAVFTFFLTAVSLNLLESWRAKRSGETVKDSNATDFPALPADKLDADKIITEAEHQVAMGNLIQEHQKKIEILNSNNLLSFNNLKKEHQQIVSAWEDSEKELVAELKKNSWLINKAQEQAENIDNYVVLERFQYSFISVETFPMLIFLAEFRNHSLFEIQLENEIGGYIDFDNKTLRSKPYFYSHSLDAIYPSRCRLFAVDVDITEAHQKAIEEFQKNTQIPIERAFRIDKLVFTIKGRNDSDNIAPKTVRIRQGFKVINNKDYQLALDKFSQ